MTVQCSGYTGTHRQEQRKKDERFLRISSSLLFLPSEQQFNIGHLSDLSLLLVVGMIQGQFLSRGGIPMRDPTSPELQTNILQLGKGRKILGRYLLS